MDAVLRAAAIYVALMIILRIIGKRSLSQITTFDFVLLLVIGQAIQQAILGYDYSITNAVLIILTLIGFEVGLTRLKLRWPKLNPWLDDVPLILVENGQPIERRLQKTRVTEDDIMQAARGAQGLERMDQIKYAVLERTGDISIIPQPGE